MNNTENQKPFVGQRIICPVGPIGSNKYVMSRIDQVFEPGAIGTYCGHTYVNNNNHITIAVANLGIVPDYILQFFQSEQDAEMWMLKKELEATKKQLETEKTRRAEAEEKLGKIRETLRRL
jgi:hypothetical protein